MRKAILLLLAVTVSFSATGCTYLGSETRLDEPAASVGFRNITTGDGTFENYQAIGHYAGREFGIGIGIWGYKWMELYPVQSNEELVLQMAQQAQADGSDSMILVTAPTTVFIPIILPFAGIGIYWDKTAGTGIKLR